MSKAEELSKLLHLDHCRSGVLALVAGLALVPVEAFGLGDIGLNQPPDRSGPNAAAGSDASIEFDSFVTEAAMAQQFVVATSGGSYDVERITVWAIYSPGDTPPATDDFTVIIHADTGVPNADLCTENSIVPTSRTPTGEVVNGLTEYMFHLDLSTSCNLSDGTYWVEVFNNTPATDDWHWEAGVRDTVNGTGKIAVALETPGVDWGSAVDGNQAIVLDGTLNSPAQCGGTSATDYAPGTKYAPGALVRNVGKLFQCSTNPVVAPWCQQAAFAPGSSVHWRNAWTQVQVCTVAPTPCTTTTWTQVQYNAGDLVVHAGTEYACKGYPFTNWCGQNPVYAPGTGLYWSRAWDRVRTCP